MSTTAALWAIASATGPWLGAVAIRVAIAIAGSAAAILLALWLSEQGDLIRRALRHQRRVRLATAVADVDERQRQRAEWERTAEDAITITRPCRRCIPAASAPVPPADTRCRCGRDCGHPLCQPATSEAP